MGRSLRARVAQDLRSDPFTASTYKFLIDAEITTYYTPRGLPNKADADDDGLTQRGHPRHRALRPGH